MTTHELREKFNNEFGIETWPKTFEVDADTYANVVQDLFNYHKSKYNYTMLEYNIWSLNIIVGSNNGVLYKGVELILKR